MSLRKKLILVVIDGLTPDVFEAVDDSSAPTLAALAAAGNYRRAVSTFPSLTPVCLASIATGGGPDVHGIPHLTAGSSAWSSTARRSAPFAPPAPGARSATRSWR